MSTALLKPPLKTWTRSEIDALQEAGILQSTRLELIDGELFDKMGQNPPHASAVRRLAAALIAIFGAGRVTVQLPVEPGESDRSRSLPEPDVAVTSETETAYRTRHPGAADLLLVAEVADTTYDFDAKRKAKLYARSGFAEYILLDLTEGELICMRTPNRGVYTEIHVLRPGDAFHPLAAPDSSLSVADLLAE